VKGAFCHELLTERELIDADNAFDIQLVSMKQEMIGKSLFLPL